MNKSKKSTGLLKNSLKSVWDFEFLNFNFQNFFKNKLHSYCKETNTMLDIITILGGHNDQIIKYYTEYKASGSTGEENTTVVCINM